MSPTKLERLIAEMEEMCRNISGQSLAEIQMVLSEAKNALTTLRLEVERINPGAFETNPYAVYYANVGRK